MIVQVRGPMGSGKSTAVHALIDQHGGTVADEVPFTKLKRNGEEDTTKIKFWRCAGDLLALGSYSRREGESVSRGAGGDGMQGTVARDAIDHAVSLGARHVVYEGLFPSQEPVPSGEWLTRLLDLGVVWATLDTPVETCAVNVKARRVERGTNASAPVNLDRLRSQRAATDRKAAEGVAASIPSVTVRYAEGVYQQVHDLLMWGGWDCGHGRDPARQWRWDVVLSSLNTKKGATPSAPSQDPK